jgi:exonuclease SbcC
VGLESVEVEDFQSIQKVEVVVGGFTVIVGPSNSGKSAFLRAIKTVAYNATSPAFVRKGERVAQLRLAIDDRVVGLTRGRSVSTYIVDDGSTQETYAKAGTSVPKAVQAVLRFVEIEGEPLNFAFQFDRPYLVSDTGSKIAKVLGDLTNITLVYDAVREVNRRRLEAGTKRKIRVSDTEGLTERLEAYRGLARQKAATEALRARYDHQEAVRRVQAQVEVARLAEQVMSREIPAPVSMAGLDEKIAELEALHRAVRTVKRFETERDAKWELFDRADEALTAAKQEEQAYLKEVGVCPVCGREM